MGWLSRRVLGDHLAGQQPPHFGQATRDLVNFVGVVLDVALFDGHFGGWVDLRGDLQSSLTLQLRVINTEAVDFVLNDRGLSRDLRLLGLQ